jgi:hypothetical protein
MSTVLESVLAEALFASTLQSSQRPADEEVRAAVRGTLQRLGIGGCAGQVAGEFGDHPETAVARMCWALAAIGRAYAVERATAPTPLPTVLAA